MNTLEKKPDQPLMEETGDIIACAIEVSKTLGCGHSEEAYEHALAIEFGLRNIAYTYKQRFPLTYKGTFIGEFVANLIVFDKVAIEVRVTDNIANGDYAQVVNTLKASGCKVGLILNFKNATLQTRRVSL